MSKPAQNNASADFGSVNSSFSPPAPEAIRKLLHNLPARSREVPEEYAQWIKKIIPKVDPKRRAEIERVFQPMLLQIAKELPKDATIEMVFRKLFEIQREALSSSRALSSPVPILRSKGVSDQLTSLGTGIFIKMAGRFVLLTAAHVLDAGDDANVFVGVNEAVLPLTGKWYRNPLPDSGNREHDRVDVGYCLLAGEEIIGELQTCDRVLYRSDVILNESLPGLSLRVCGYPAKKIQFGPDQLVSTNLTSLEGNEISSKEYAKLGLNPDVHLALRYNRKRGFSGRHARTTTPMRNLQGMSGGGIFVEVRVDGPPFLDFQLVAITTNHSRLDRSVVYGTRLNEFVKCIHANCPELRC